MNRSVVRWLAFCLPVVLGLAGCQSAAQKIVPVTGAEASPVPDQALLARDKALEYVIAAARLSNLPSSAAWQLDNEQPVAGEYHFSSGDWRMIVWAPAQETENQRVIIRNQAQPAFWCGYVKPDGQVVDTDYQR